MTEPPLGSFFLLRQEAVFYWLNSLYEQIVSANLKSMLNSLFHAPFRSLRVDIIVTLLSVSILSLAVLPCMVVAAMYKQIDKDGNVSYTDVPDKANVKPINPAPIMTFSAPPSAGRNVQPARGRNSISENSENSENEKTFKPASSTSYQSFMITSPQAGAAVRANGGSISIQITTEPALDTEHRVILIIDGQTKAQGQSTSFTIAGVERGAHTLSARIESADGNVLINANSVSFQVLRTSVQRAN